MTRLYTIDEETGEIMEAEKPSNDSPSQPFPASPEGRTVLIPTLQFMSVLDWRSEDDAAEEMLITAGISRPSIVVNPGLVSMYETPALPSDPSAYPFASIEYGIGGMTETIVIDVVPEQKISLPASFVRVKIYNALTTDQLYFASVCKSRGNPHLSTRLGVAHGINFGATWDFNVPAFARTVKIDRAQLLGGGLLRGSVMVSWSQGGQVIDRANYAALADIPELIVPSGAAVLTIANTEAAGTQRVTVTWFLEP